MVLKPLITSYVFYPLWYLINMQIVQNKYKQGHANCHWQSAAMLNWQNMCADQIENS